MKKIVVILSALSVVAMTACQRDNSLPESKNEAILIEASIGAQTRAPQLVDDGSGHFAVNDVIGIYIKQNTTTLNDLKVANADYKITTYTAADNFTAEYGPYYWQDLGASKLQFSGYYPKIATVADPEAYVFDASTVTAVGDFYKKDLLLAKAEITYPAASVALQFDHMMHRVIVNLVTGADAVGPYYTDAMLTGATVTLHTKEAALVDIIGKSSAEKTDATVNDVVLCQAVDAAASNGDAAVHSRTFIVAPQAITADMKLITVNIDGKEYSYAPSTTEVAKLPDGQMKANNQTVLTLTLQKQSIAVTAVTINAWGDTVSIDTDPIPVIPGGE